MASKKPPQCDIFIDLKNIIINNIVEVIFDH